MKLRSELFLLDELVEKIFFDLFQATRASAFTEYAEQCTHKGSRHAERSIFSRITSTFPVTTTSHMLHTISSCLGRRLIITITVTETVRWNIRGRIQSGVLSESNHASVRHSEVASFNQDNNGILIFLFNTQFKKKHVWDVRSGSENARKLPPW